MQIQKDKDLLYFVPYIDQYTFEYYIYFARFLENYQNINNN